MKITTIVSQGRELVSMMMRMNMYVHIAAHERGKRGRGSEKWLGDTSCWQLSFFLFVADHTTACTCHDWQRRQASPQYYIASKSAKFGRICGRRYVRRGQRERSKKSPSLRALASTNLYSFLGSVPLPVLMFIPLFNKARIYLYKYEMIDKVMLTEMREWESREREKREGGCHNWPDISWHIAKKRASTHSLFGTDLFPYLLIPTLKILLEHRNDFISTLNDCVNVNKADQLAQALVNVFEHHNQTVEMICFFISREVRLSEVTGTSRREKRESRESREGREGE